MPAKKTNSIDYVREAIASYFSDPPDTSFQRGYAHALLDVWLEGMDQKPTGQTKALEEHLKNMEE